MTLPELTLATRLRSRPTRDQRKALCATMASFQQPETALELVRPCLPYGCHPQAIACTVKSVHPDRFVLHVRVGVEGGEELALALKVYADDFGRTVWRLAQALAGRDGSVHDGVCVPTRYLPERRTLVFGWVEGPRLSEVVDERKLELLRRAARLVADLHRAPLVAVPPLTADMVVADTLDRCGRLRYRWPSMADSLESVLALVRKTANWLDLAVPRVVHGDLAAGQFLWTGSRLVLLDLDAAALADPAYDVGHFLGQLERRCVLDPSLPPHAREWLSCFRDAYRSAMPGISWRNVSFYQGLTLLRKMYTLCRRDTLGGPRLAVPLAERARAAFEAVTA
jgi:phosphotransferase family enzyme